MLFTSVKSLKRRLQFTGWLQYLPTALLALACTFAAALAGNLDVMPAAYLLIAAAALLLAVLLFDLITVKLHLHPAERLPKRNDDLDLFDLMRARRSCRSFQIRKLTSADYKALMDIVRCQNELPECRRIGKYPVRFEYVSAPLTVWPVVGASEFLVAIAPSMYNRLAVIDVGRNLQKIVIGATRMGLATCWIGPGADQSSIVRQMGDRFNSESDHIICVCAVGYKSWYKPIFLHLMQFLQRRRLPLSALFFADAHLTEPLQVGMYPFNRFGRSYEICQWSPSSFNSQTTRCAAVMAPKGDSSGSPGKRLARFDFYATTDSRYYAAVALGIWCANWEMGCAALGIHGHFAILPAGERGVLDAEDRPQLPRYDVSWVLEDDI